MVKNNSYNQMDSRLKKYIPIAQFIYESSNRRYQVQIRDVKDESSTLVYVLNGALTGELVTDEVKGYKFLNLLRGSEENFRVNYTTIESEKVIRNSTYFIKDEEVIGLLIVKEDITKLLDIRSTIETDLLYGAVSEIGTYDESVDKIVESIIDSIALNRNRRIPLYRIEMEDNPIRQLHRLKVFNYKGAIQRAADLLGISTQSIYRYIQELDKEEK